MVLHQVHKKYDLKGSTVEREASEKEKQKKEPTLKVRVISKIQTPDLALRREKYIPLWRPFRTMTLSKMA